VGIKREGGSSLAHATERAQRTWRWRGAALPAGRGRCGGCRVAWVGERGGARGPRVENVDQPGEKGNGLGP
jgi:hypothetical protein